MTLNRQRGHVRADEDALPKKLLAVFGDADQRTGVWRP